MEWLPKVSNDQLRATRMLAELPQNREMWQSAAYAHWVNQLASVSEFLPMPQKEWYAIGYTQD